MAERERARRGDPTAPGSVTTTQANNASALTGSAVVELHQAHGDCPVCGEPKLNVRKKPRGRGWWVQCWVCEDGPSYLAAVAEEVGCRPYQLLEDPLTRLEPWLDRAWTSSTPSEEAPPTGAHVAGWASRLQATDHALDWLYEERGLTEQVVRDFEFGYDGDRDAITIPVCDERGEPVNLRRRFLDPSADPKIVGLARPACLYPMQALADDPRGFVVCEGEFDALLLNQHDIPAVTSTAGTSWHPEWNRYVVGRKVAILYDAGAASYEKAEQRAEDFVAAGARDAWPVDLTLAGFRKGEDVTDWFVGYGYSARELRLFIKRSRHWYREAK